MTFTMRTILKIKYGLLAALLLLLCSGCAELLVEPNVVGQEPLSEAEQLTNLAAELGGEIALVTWVIDGDTVDVELDGEKYRVRYIGVDTPERDQWYYEEATDMNIALVKNKEVVLVKDVSETDRYGRLLRYVYLADGTFVNGYLVEAGYATAVTFPPDVALVDELRALEQAARADGVGLWADR